MAKVDLHKFALRLKVAEMIRIYARRRMLEEASTCWRRLILPN
jgi:pentatricopeptide repeat protein